MYIIRVFGIARRLTVQEVALVKRGAERFHVLD